MEIKNSVVLLQPGIYILRHPKEGLSPITVSRAPGAASSKGKIEALWTPATQGAVLRDGGDCIVMQVSDSPVELLVSAFMEQAGAKMPTLRIDRIGLDEPSAPAAADAAGKPVNAAKTIRISDKGISIIGHVERLGDAVASEGQALGDPGGNLRLEGFQVMWPDHPEGVDLAYSVAIEGAGAMPTVKSGNFCGTKGEARRITEVTFTLVGAQANKFELDGVAHFSGGFQVPLASGMPLSGPSGLEHLTALSIKAKPATSTKAKNPWDESSRTKVFKAKAAAPQKTEVKKTVKAK